MPTYEYRCTDCGENLEVVQSFQDDPLTECPKCHGKLRKVFGSIGISFKGSGFYRNDSRTSVGSSSSSSGTGGDGSSSSSDSGDSTSSSSEKSTSTSTSTSDGNGSSSGKTAASSSSS